MKAAVRWATERARGIVLLPCDWAGGYTDGSTVLDVLHLKHLDPCIPSSTSFLHCDVLPQFEDMEIISCHVLLSAHRIQGSAGPGGCDACHWQDGLLRYGAHSSRLRDAVAAFSHRLGNTIVPWNLVRALVSYRLIALDKCPGVRPVGVGETLDRLWIRLFVWLLVLILRTYVLLISYVGDQCLGLRVRFMP